MNTQNPPQGSQTDDKLQTHLKPPLARNVKWSTLAEIASDAGGNSKEEEKGTEEQSSHNKDEAQPTAAAETRYKTGGTSAVTEDDEKTKTAYQKLDSEALLVETRIANEQLKKWDILIQCDPASAQVTYTKTVDAFPEISSSSEKSMVVWRLACLEEEAARRVRVRKADSIARAREIKTSNTVVALCVDCAREFSKSVSSSQTLCTVCQNPSTNQDSKSHVNARARRDEARKAASEAEKKRLAALEGVSAAEAIAAVEEHKYGDHEEVKEREEKKDDDKRPREKKICEVLMTGGTCLLGRECPHIHPELDNEPVRFATLDADPGDGTYISRRDEYTENPDANHVRTLEPQYEAWADYDLPVVSNYGRELLNNVVTSTEAQCKYMARPFGTVFVTTGKTMRVRLLRYVVDTLRTKMMYTAREPNLATFLVCTASVPRIMSNLRVTPSEILLHKQFAPLVAYYDVEHLNYIAHVGQATWDLTGAYRIGRFLGRNARPIKIGAAIIGGSYVSKAVVRQWLINRSLRRMLTAATVINSDMKQVVAAKEAEIARRLSETERLASFYSKREAYQPCSSQTDWDARVVDPPMKLAKLGSTLRRWFCMNKSFDNVSRAATTEQSVSGNVVDALCSMWRSLKAMVPRGANSTPVDVSDVTFTYTRIIIAPIIEEAIKHVVDEKGERNWGGGAAALLSILAVEWCATLLEVGTRNKETGDVLLAGRACTTVMHVATFFMPIHYAMITHSVWNMVVAPLMVAPVMDVKVVPQHTGDETADFMNLLRCVSGSAGSAMHGICTVALAVANQRALKKRAEQARRNGGYLLSDKCLHKARGRAARAVEFYEGDRMVPTNTPAQKEHTKITVGASNEVASTDIDVTRMVIPGCPMPERGIHSNQDPTRRMIVAKYGFGTPLHRGKVAAHTLENVLAVAQNRIIAATQEADPADKADFGQYVVDKLDEILHYDNGCPIRGLKSVSRDHFLNNIGSSPAIVKLLRRTFDKLDEMGIDENSTLSGSFLKMITRHKVFVKVESLSLNDETGSKDKAARPIVPCNPFYSCLTGPWLMAFCGVMKKCWHKDHFITMAGGDVKNEDIGAAVEKCWRRGFGIIEDDVAKWDISLDNAGAPIWNVAAHVYNVMGAPHVLIQIIMSDKTGRFVMSFNIIIYKRHGQMNSGKWETFHMNGFFNGFSHLYLASRAEHDVGGEKRRLTLSEIKETHKFIVAGDDDIVMYKATLKTNYRLGMAKLGFAADTLGRKCIDATGFCSALCWPSSDGYKMTPKPGRVISRISYAVNPPRDVEPESFIRGSVLGAYKDNSHVPPTRALMDRLLELTSGFKPSYGRDYEMKTHARGASSATIDTWECLMERYPYWSYSVQCRWEQYLATLQLGDDIDFPEMTEMMNLDCDGPADHTLSGSLTDFDVAPNKSLGPYHRPDCAMVDPSCPGSWSPIMSHRKYNFWWMDAQMYQLCADHKIDCGYTWSISAKARNKKKHTEEGNGTVPPAVAAIFSFAATTYGLTRAVFSGLTDDEPEDITTYFIRLPNQPLEAVETTMRAGKVVPEDIVEHVTKITGLLKEDFMLMFRGRQLRGKEPVTLDSMSVIDVIIKIRGGSGERPSSQLRSILKQAGSTKKATSRATSQVRSVKKSTSRRRDLRSSRKKKSIKKKEHHRTTHPPSTNHHIEHHKKEAHQKRGVADRMLQADMSIAEQTLVGMVDPFQFQPPAFGTPTGTIVSTTVSTYSVTTPTGANGVACTAFLPMPTNAFRVGVGLISSIPGWGPTPTMGGGAINAYSQGRLLAAGIRWNVRVAEGFTAPGFIHGGLVPITTGVSDILGFAAADLINTPNIVKIDGRNNYTGTITWRPVDSQEAEMSASMGIANAVITSNGIFLAFTEWPPSTIISLEYVEHIEEQPLGNSFFGIGSGLCFADHDWGVIMDAVAALGGRAFQQVLQHGTKYVAHMAMRAASEGWASWLAGGLRMSNPHNELLPNSTDGEYTVNYLATVIEPARRRAREAELEAQIMALEPASIDARINAILASKLRPSTAADDKPTTASAIDSYIISKLQSDQYVGPASAAVEVCDTERWDVLSADTQGGDVDVANSNTPDEVERGLMAEYTRMLTVHRAQKVSHL